MRRHIIIPFGGVLKNGIPIWNQAGKKTLKIPANLRVGILLDHE